MGQGRVMCGIMPKYGFPFYFNACLKMSDDAEMGGDKTNHKLRGSIV